mgnify:CR=1 FL=1
MLSIVNYFNWLHVYMIPPNKGHYEKNSYIYYRSAVQKK